MRPSIPVSGIKGIFPLILKESPTSFHYLHRYTSLSGYRLAIDATLLVQRYHFAADDENPNRHLLGLHRLIATLRASNVFPIFVFDHLSERMAIKSRETERRRLVRALVKKRMALERSREQRLRSLGRVMARLDDEGQIVRGKVRAVLLAWQGKNGEGSAHAGGTNPHWLDEVEESGMAERGKSVDQWADEIDRQFPENPTDDLHNDNEGPARVLLHSVEASEDLLQRLASQPKPLLDGTDVADDSHWLAIYEDQTSTVMAISRQIWALRRDFEDNHLAVYEKEQETFTQTSTQLRMNKMEKDLYESLVRDAVLPSTAVEKSEEILQQVGKEMTSETGAVDALQALPIADAPSPGRPEQVDAPSVPPPAPPIDQLRSMDEIQDQNRTLVRSWARRTSGPSAATWEECVTLCDLLRVPVVWTGSGNPYGGSKGEAEALAASLVTSGQADAVATEDGDVLLAEVPLIRGLTGTKRFLELVDTKDVRKTLFPPLASDSVSPSTATSTPPETVHTASSTDTEDWTDPALEAASAVSRSDKLSRYAMLDFSLLCGTDYNRTIPGLGSRGALKLLKEHRSIRRMLRASKGKYQPPDGLNWKEYGAELTAARNAFKNPPDALRALKLAGITPAAVAESTTSSEEDVDGQAVPSSLTIPPPPAVPLMDSVFLSQPSPSDRVIAQSLGLTAPLSSQRVVSAASQQAQPRVEPSRGQASMNRIFPVPEYDRVAVRAFLKARMLSRVTTKEQASSPPSASSSSSPQAQEQKGAFPQTQTQTQTQTQKQKTEASIDEELDELEHTFRVDTSSSRSSWQPSSVATSPITAESVPVNGRAQTQFGSSYAYFGIGRESQPGSGARGGGRRRRGDGSHLSGHSEDGNGAVEAIDDVVERNDEDGLGFGRPFGSEGPPVRFAFEKWT